MALISLGTGLVSRPGVTTVQLQNLDHQDSVIDKDLVTAPGSPTAGDRYIIAGIGGNWSGGTIDDIAQSVDGAANWSFVTPNTGFDAWIEDEAKEYIFTGGAWTINPTVSGGIANVVEDTTPQLGGQLDVNGFALGDGTLELLKFIETAVAVNEITLKNNSTANDPEVQATGGDADIGVNLISKGSGVNKSDGVEIVNLSAAQILTEKSLTNPIMTTQTLTDGANIAWNLDSGGFATVTLAGNRTLDNPTNMNAGGVYYAIIKQDATGSRTLAYGTAYDFPGGNAPILTTTANAVDIIAFISDGTSMFAVMNPDFK